MLRPKRLVKLYCIFPNKLVELILTILQNNGTVHLFDVKEENKLLKPLEIKNESKLNEITEKVVEYKKEIEKRAEKSPFGWLIGPRYVVIEPSEKKKRDVIKDAKKVLAEIEKKYGKIDAENANEAKKVYYPRLLTIIENLEDIKEKANAMKKFGRTKHIVSFGGFATEEDALKVMNAIDIASSGRCAFEVKDATAEDKPPSMLSNPSLIKPFEILTENYGMPSYNGIDPTFILAVTFTLLFGVMFPDMGYGIVLVFLSTLVYLATRKTTKFIRNLNIILIYCGLSSIFFGFLFGEFLGGLMKLKPIFEPTKDILNMLLISIVIGLVHISIGLISNAFLEKGHLRYSALLLSLWSIVLFVLSKNGIYLWLFTAAAIFLIFKKGFFIVEEIIEIFTHIMSYIRIGVLSIAHITISRLLAQAILALPRDATGLWLGISLMFLGAMVSLVLGVLIVFLQSLRLHWLEFFGTYEFTGKKFEPFKHRKEHLYAT